MQSSTPTFTARPFDGTLSPATFYCAPGQEEALARLEWLHDQRQRFGLVTAVTGGGKSHLLAAAARRLGGAGAEVAVLSLAGLEEGAWIEMILDRLPLDPASRADPGRPWTKLEARCRENMLMERTTALLLDDLDRGPADVIAGVSRLVGAVEAWFSRVLVVATASPSAVALLPAQLHTQVAVRIDLAPWNEADVAGFLAWEGERVGATEPLFTPVAAGAVARFTAGVPRDVVRLARLALAAAAGAGLASADPTTVEQAWCELFPSPVAPRPVSPATLPMVGPAAAEDAAPAPPPTVRPVRRLWG
ncbi:MAG: hypothetical protein EBR86_15450 [Planctomycetia bacterium]|nr:hypothetical protein [Planctomycetia bacterium]